MNNTELSTPQTLQPWWIPEKLLYCWVGKTLQSQRWSPNFVGLSWEPVSFQIFFVIIWDGVLTIISWRDEATEFRTPIQGNSYLPCPQPYAKGINGRDKSLLSLMRSDCPPLWRHRLFKYCTQAYFPKVGNTSLVPSLSLAILESMFTVRHLLAGQFSWAIASRTIVQYDLLHSIPAKSGVSHLLCVV